MLANEIVSEEKGSGELIVLGLLGALIVVLALPLASAMSTPSSSDAVTTISQNGVVTE